MASTIVRCKCGMQFQVGSRPAAAKIQCPACQSELSLRGSAVSEPPAPDQTVRWVERGIAIVALVMVSAIGLWLGLGYFRASSPTTPAPAVIQTASEPDEIEEDSALLKTSTKDARIDASMLPRLSFDGGSSSSTAPVKDAPSLGRAKLHSRLQSGK